MDFNKTVARKLAKIFTVVASPRSAKIAKIHADNRGADLAFVNVEVKVGEQLIFAGEVTAKIRSGRRTIALPTYVGSDGKRRLRYFVSNEVRALMILAVFADESIAALAERFERKLAAQSEDVDSTDVETDEDLGLEDESVEDGSDEDIFAGI